MPGDNQCRDNPVLIIPKMRPNRSCSASGARRLHHTIHYGPRCKRGGIRHALQTRDSRTHLCRTKDIAHTNIPYAYCQSGFLLFDATGLGHPASGTEPRNGVSPEKAEQSAWLPGRCNPGTFPFSRGLQAGEDSLNQQLAAIPP